MTRMVCGLTVLGLIACGMSLVPLHAGQDRNPLDPLLEKIRARPGQAEKPFNLVVRFKVKADQVDAVLAAAKKAVPASRAEKGCMAYDVQQNLEDPTEFYVLETWRDAEGLQFHSRTDHFDDFLKVIGAAVEEPPQIRLSHSVVPKP